MTEERDDRHVRDIANAIRDQIGDDNDAESVTRLAGAALGDEAPDPESDSPDDDPAAPAEPIPPPS